MGTEIAAFGHAIRPPLAMEPISTLHQMAIPNTLDGSTSHRGLPLQACYVFLSHLASWGCGGVSPTVE